MSDGPHRTLPMRRAWKELLKRADKKVYSLDEVRQALPRAISNDWSNEVSHALVSALKAVFVGRDNSLRIPEIALEKLEAAKPLAAGSNFGESAVKWCVQMVHEGRIDEAGLLEAVGCAAMQRAYSGFRSAEEHYFRESTQRRADGVRERLESAASGLAPSDLGRQLIDPESRPERHRRKTDIDDGVRLQ